MLLYHVLKSFCFFYKDDLLEYVSDITEIAESKKDYKKLYTRENRKDVLVKVRYDDIKHLQTQAIRYDTERHNAKEV